MTFPWRGRAVPEYRDRAVRKIYVGSYRLIYRIAEANIAIIAFIDGARDLAALTRDEGEP